MILFGVIGPLALAPLLLVVGWIPFLWKTIPEMTIEPAAFAAAAALVAFVLLFHWLAGWLFRQTRTTDEAPTARWRIRWTAASVAIVLMPAVHRHGAVELPRYIPQLAAGGGRSTNTSKGSTVGLPFVSHT